MDNGKKNTVKVLTTDDIRKNARDWTLAGDVGLLAHLEQFSENIHNKTKETQKYFDEVLENYEEVYTKVGNITNQFLALQNCQFVENRVYDEETPTEEKTEVKVEDEAERERLLLMQYKEAVEVGVRLLDTHFHEVQLPPNSDSDEEDEPSVGNSIIWRPKNPYADKKFPLLIGSAEWWADDSVGLANHHENLESERIISESESEAESIKSLEKKTKSSSSSSVEYVKQTPLKQTFLESSSEDLFGLDKKEEVKNGLSEDEFSTKGANIINEPINFLPPMDSEGKGDKEEPENIPENATKPPRMVDNAFTRELMAKLVTVKGEKEEKPEGVVQQTPQPPQQQQKQQPPPQPAKSEPPSQGSIFDETDDDGNDLFSGSIRGKTITAESKGLFFDGENDDGLFAGSNDLFSNSRSDLFKSDSLTKPPSVKEAKISQPKKNLVDDLFDDLDDDKLFAPKQNENQREKSVEKKSESASAGEFSWDNDEGLFDSINNDIDGGFLSRPGFLQDDGKKGGLLDGTLGSKEKSEVKVGLPQNGPKAESDVEDAEKKDRTFEGSGSKESLFSKQPTDRISSILGEEEDDDLFSTSFKEEKKSGKVPGFLDDESAALFLEKPKLQDSLSISSSRSSLFDDAPASKSRLASVFNKEKSGKMEEEDDLFSVSDDSLFAGGPKTTTATSGKDLFGGKGKKEEKSSLFSDSDDEDLFGSAKDTDIFGDKSLFEKKAGDGDKKVKEPDLFVGDGDKKTEVGSKSFVDDFADDDLFGASVKKEETRPAKIVSEVKSEVSFERSLFSDDLGDGGDMLFAVGEIKPKPPSSLSIKPTQEEAKSKSVGKLNIPGNLKSKLETIQAKQISPGGMIKSAEKKVVEEVEQKKVEEEAEVKKIGEEVEEPLPALLKCPSRDRVRIPAGRRPQSRRARQEAIRNADAPWEDVGSSTSKTTDVKDASISSPVVSNPLSPSTDEEDFFNVPELDTNLEEEDQSLFKSSLFQSAKSSKSEDNLLFDSAPVLSPLNETAAPETGGKISLLFSSSEKTKPGLSIFEDDFDGDDDDDENLFRTEEPQKALFRAGHGGPSAEEKPKTSLFDDADDDSIFGGGPTPTPRTKIPETKKPDNTESKEKKNQAFVDPLGLMSSDD